MEAGRPGERMSRSRYRWLGIPPDALSTSEAPPLPEFIPGGAKQTEGEGGVSQLLQQLGGKVLCQCLEDSSPLL